MMGMESGPKVEKPISTPPLKPPTLPNDPNTILQKLNDKNNEFISAYNASAL